MADEVHPLATIDPTVLATVTGGASSSSDQIATMLQSLMSSIKDLAQSRNQGSGSDFMQMLPMMMMMSRGPSGPVEAAPSPLPPDGDPNGWTKVA